jgi:hypothetical protein
MRRSHIAIALAALASGGATPAPSAKPDVRLEAMDQGLAQWEDCVDAAADKYDDRTSDVMSVAAAIQSMCSRKFIEFLSNIPRGGDDIGIIQEAEDNRDGLTREIAAKVLIVRASHPRR